MPFRRILIRATNWVGDAVMAVPALEQIRARFPQAHIAMLARPWVSGLYDKSLIDEIVPYTAAKGWGDLRGKWELAGRLRQMRFDAAILQQNAFEAAALVWLAGIPVRIGYNREGRGLLLSDPIRVPKPGEIPDHQRFYYLEMLRRAGLIEQLPESPMIRLPGIPYLQKAGARRLEGTWIGLSPGAAYGTAKRWLPERFAAAGVAVARELAAQVAVFGSPDERELCEGIAAAVREAGLAAVNFAGQTDLGQFVEMASVCRAFVTNDSGAMHIASALGVPTVSVFGATDHVATGPTGPLAKVIREDVECSPCLLRDCPIDHRCMKAVAADRVAGEVLELVRIARQ
ncbi:MAG: lipopolysaccharide heptosyltransferase II [Acidobacteriota bacterium]|jgi:heptosyltransferase-2|nr:lipopolysaccharide heptosyltransferase II [Bryobacteraceae bacterium CoA2 C42]